jgi:uncharacterized membrane protein YdjX (TVP38/TMEM64 family)
VCRHERLVLPRKSGFLGRTTVVMPVLPRSPDRQIFASARARRWFVVHVLIGSILLVGAVVLLRQQLAFLFDATAVRLFVRGFGVWAPVVLIALQTLQVVVAPVPGQVLAAVAGYLFGPWWGTLYNMIGITIGSTVAFWLSRRFGRAYVERVIDDEALETFDGFVDRHGLLSLFILFLVPGLPDDALCFVGGLTPIPLWKLVLIAVVGRAPAFFLVNVVGHLVANGDVYEAMVLLALIVGLSILGYLNRDQIIKFLARRFP